MMKKIIPFGFLFLFVSHVQAGSEPPWNTAIIDQTMTGPMGMKVTTKSYLKFSNKIEDSFSAEWEEMENSFTGKKEKLTIKDGTHVYVLDLGTNRCTKTNIKAVTDMVNDPMQVAEQMKKTMNLNEAGQCTGVGNRKGILYKWSLGEICMLDGILTLWQKGADTLIEVTKLELDVTLPKDKISLPPGTKCSEGPDFSRGFTNMGSFEHSDMVEANPTENSRSQQPPPQNMEEAMKKAQEAMKSFGDLFNR